MHHSILVNIWIRSSLVSILFLIPASCTCLYKATYTPCRDQIILSKKARIIKGTEWAYKIKDSTCLRQIYSMDTVFLFRRSFKGVSKLLRRLRNFSMYQIRQPWKWRDERKRRSTFSTRGRKPLSRCWLDGNYLNGLPRQLRGKVFRKIRWSALKI